MKSLYLIPFLLAACTTPPRTKVELSPFERCVNATSKGMTYSNELLRSAAWCKENSNGGIK